MGKVKKLSSEEFIELIIDKQLEIVGADMRYKDITLMTKEEQEEFRFWEKYSFKTLEEFIEWRNFYFEHAYDYYPKRVKLKEIERNFQSFNLMWGLKYDFEIEELYNYYKMNKIWK